ncbi:MAG: pyrroline-5-carboxylate reductase [Cellvibrionaceae bacterium]|jgi:pyrroline-5-carboxylate reductase
MASIAFIGAGNMAKSLIGGLINQGYDAAKIIASDPNSNALAALRETYNVVTRDDNLQACAEANTIVLAVKPQVIKSVAQNLRPGLDRQSLIISIAAGVNSDQLGGWLGDDLAIVRCMPNTPALVGMGASGLYANPLVDREQKQMAEKLFNAVGNCIWLNNEKLIDVVTAVSGSGPAYFFLLMEAMINTGIQQGLTADQARKLTLQTAAGAAVLAQDSDVSVHELRRRVTSPGGTTEQAVLSFEKAGFPTVIADAMIACIARSQEMTKEFG